MLTGCQRDYRNRPFPIKVKVEYLRNVLTVGFWFLARFARMFYSCGLASLAVFELASELTSFFELASLAFILSSSRSLILCQYGEQ